MSKIKNGVLDQYGKVKSLNGIGGKRVNGEEVTSDAFSILLHRYFLKYADRYK